MHCANISRATSENKLTDGKESRKGDDSVYKDENLQVFAIIVARKVVHVPINRSNIFLLYFLKKNIRHYHS